MSPRALMISVAGLMSVLVVAVAVLAILAFTRVSSFERAESVQRVHTIGERCETTRHQLQLIEAYLPPSNREVRWFAASYLRCRKSLAKVEARAGVTYRP